MSRTIFGILLSVVLLSGCDVITVKKAAFDVPEAICSDHEGLLSATFFVDTTSSPTSLHKVRCNNGAIFDSDYIREYKTLKNITTEL